MSEISIGEWLEALAGARPCVPYPGRTFPALRLDDNAGLTPDEAADRTDRRAFHRWAGLT